MEKGWGEGVKLVKEIWILNLERNLIHCVTFPGSLRIKFLHVYGEKIKLDDLHRSPRMLNIYDSVYEII